MNLIDVEKNLELITSCKNTNVGIKNPKLFLDLQNRELARFISGILGDGNLNKTLMVDYNNQKKNLIDLMLNSAKTIFGDVDWRIYYKKDKVYQLHFPKIIGIYLFHMGLVPGYKVEHNQNIPNIIFNMNKDGKALFLRQFYSDEGNVRLKDRRLQIRQATQWKKTDKETLKKDIDKYAPNIIKEIKELLIEFGIKSKITLGKYRGDKSDWDLSFYGKENLEKFRDKINFDLDYKKDLLDNCIKSYKFPSAPRNGRIEFALESCKKVQGNYGYINKILLSKECKRSLKIATYYLVDLKKINLVKIIETPRNNLGHPLPVKYKLI